MASNSLLDRVRALLGGGGGQKAPASGLNLGPSTGTPTRIPRHAPGVLTGETDTPQWQPGKDEKEVLNSFLVQSASNLKNSAGKTKSTGRKESSAPSSSEAIS